MDPVALMLSVQRARRDARSALPHAEVRTKISRWERTVAAVRRAGRGTPPPGD